MGSPVLFNGDGNQMDEQSLHGAFTMFDLNLDGRISESELGSVLKSLGFRVAPEEIKQMIREADKDGNGTVEFHEFMQMMRRYFDRRRSQSTDDQLREVFDVFDQNRDSLIDFDEIKRTMQVLGETVTDAQVREMILEADRDHDGFVDFEEFKLMMKLVQNRKETNNDAQNNSKNSKSKKK